MPIPRPLALLCLVPVALGLAACGGGGDDGDQEAFCNLAAEVNDQPGDATDRQLDRLEATAPSSIHDAVELLADFSRAADGDDLDALDDFDDDDLQDASEDVDRFLDRECGIDVDETTETTADATAGSTDDDEASLDGFCDVSAEVITNDTPSSDDVNRLLDVAPDELRDDLEELLSATEVLESGDDDAIDDLDVDDLSAAAGRVRDFAVEECGIEAPDGGTSASSGSDTTEPDDADDGDAIELGDPAPAPDLDDETEAGLAADCEDGDLGACDTLYLITDFDSVGEDYGSTCGGRLPLSQEQQGTCEAVFG